MVSAPLKIGAVAQRSGLSVKTIRFYCDEGLIHPCGRSEGRYRLFGEEVLAELMLIRTLKAMDIPLRDITRILESRRSGFCTCSSLQATIRTKLLASDAPSLSIAFRLDCALPCGSKVGSGHRGPWSRRRRGAAACRQSRARRPSHPLAKNLGTGSPARQPQEKTIGSIGIC